MRTLSGISACLSKNSLNPGHLSRSMLSSCPCSRYAWWNVFIGLRFHVSFSRQEETEYRSDGTHRVIRPARLSLARVSVLRGDGPKEGVPFIDDHIHTSEVIVDYLTEFSGIKCKFILFGYFVVFFLIESLIVGDLDPHLSRYTLTPLKLVYKKLRVLVDWGCIFIGHGLSKDFRIISMFLSGVNRSSLNNCGQTSSYHQSKS